MPRGLEGFGGWKRKKGKATEAKKRRNPGKPRALG